MLTTKENSPTGLKLLHSLEGHEDHIFSLAWSPTGERLASASNDGTVRVWDWRRGKTVRVLTYSQKPTSERKIDILVPRRSMISTVAWSSKGNFLACGVGDGSIVIWNDRWKEFHFPENHTGIVYRLCWSPDGEHLASCAEDGSIRLWGNTKQLRHQLRLIRSEACGVFDFAWSPDGRKLTWVRKDGKIIIRDVETGDESHHALATKVISIAWNPGDQLLAVGADDSTIRILDATECRELRILEGHTSPVHRLSFSSDGQLLVSSGHDRRDTLWRCDTWEAVSVIKDQPEFLRAAAFHPRSRHLATISSKAGVVIRVWQLDRSILFSDGLGKTIAKQYANAKVVIVGDDGAGKSGLSLVLSGKPFKPTPLSHARRVWTFERQTVELEDGRYEIREILLWDLAGQADYRLVQQLNLNEVAIALVVFDSRCETDPFVGIRYWDRALRQAHQLQEEDNHPPVKILVAARSDSGSVSASHEEIKKIKNELGFRAYFETSALEGRQIPELMEAIRHAISWDSLPKVSSNQLFQDIQQFLVEEKKAGRLLSTSDELYRAFRKVFPQHTGEGLRPHFDTCVERVESRGLIRRLRFGNHILLKPGILDAFASGIIQAAKRQPDGLGYIAEEDVISGNFTVSEDTKLIDTSQKKLLLISTVEELLRHEIGFRESSEDRVNLVFPSQLTTEKCESFEVPERSIAFSFEGAVMNIYSTLIVRLAKSTVFSKKEMWRSAASFKALVGGTCGLLLHEIGEGKGELSLFFDQDASESTRYQFESYVATHLERRAIIGTVVRSRIFVCQHCGASITKEQAEARRARGFEVLECPVCGVPVSLRDGEERLESAQITVVKEMDREADASRENEAGVLISKGKAQTCDYDVFMCHNSRDKNEVKKIAEKLRQKGLLPWLDEWEIRPGGAWQTSLVESISSIRSAAVFIGSHGVGPWQDMEQSAILQQFLRAKRSVIPVILPGVSGEPEIPLFLQSFHLVDFRTLEPDPMEQLIWGVTGERPIALHGELFGSIARMHVEVREDD